MQNRAFVISNEMRDLNVPLPAASSCWGLLANGAFNGRRTDLALLRSLLRRDDKGAGLLQLALVLTGKY
jgi:hypothetical protein